MKISDLVIHIGASPRGFRLRLATEFGTRTYKDITGKVYPRATIIFIDGRYDWKDQWKVFNGWDKWTAGWPQ